MKIATLMLCLLALTPFGARAQQIEPLPSDSALERVQEMRGVVLVDLYADW